MVMMAMPLSLVSCTRSVIEGLSCFVIKIYALFAQTPPASITIDGDAFAMKRGVAKCRFRRLRSTVVQMKIVFPRETHAAMNLNASVADGAPCVAGIHLGDGNRGRRVRRVFFQRPPGVVHGGTRALRFQIHVRALVLHSLEHSDRFAELFAGLGIFDGDIECPLHTADHFGSQRSGGNVECSREVRRRADFFCRSVAGIPPRRVCA